jgi:hypothetical protein
MNKIGLNNLKSNQQIRLSHNTKTKINELTNRLIDLNQIFDESQNNSILEKLNLILKSKHPFKEFSSISGSLVEITSATSFFEKELLKLKSNEPPATMKFMRDPPSKLKLLEDKLIPPLNKINKFFYEHKSVITSKNNFFEYNFSVYESKFESTRNCFKNLHILNSRLENKKKEKYNSNILMVHEFISALNDSFIYLNDCLLKLRVIDKTKKKDFSNYLFGISKDNKEGRDSSANNIVQLINWLISIEDLALNKINLKTLKNFFTIYQTLIRNFYSHGWLDIFPLICLDIDNEQNFSMFSLNYQYIKKNNEDENVELCISMLESHNFKESIIDLEKSSSSESLLKTDEEIIAKYLSVLNETQQLILPQTISRALLRKISNETVYLNLKLENFPKKITIFAQDDLNPDIDISIESFNASLNDLIKIIDSMIERELLSY